MKPKPHPIFAARAPFLCCLALGFAPSAHAANGVWKGSTSATNWDNATIAGTWQLSGTSTLTLDGTSPTIHTGVNGNVLTVMAGPVEKA